MFRRKSLRSKSPGRCRPEKLTGYSEIELIIDLEHIFHQPNFKLAFFKKLKSSLPIMYFTTGELNKKSN